MILLKTEKCMKAEYLKGRVFIRLDMENHIPFRKVSAGTYKKTPGTLETMRRCSEIKCALCTVSAVYLKYGGIIKWLVFLV